MEQIRSIKLSQFQGLGAFLIGWNKLLARVPESVQNDKTFLHTRTKLFVNQLDNVNNSLVKYILQKFHYHWRDGDSLKGEDGTPIQEGTYEFLHKEVTEFIERSKVKRNADQAKMSLFDHNYPAAAFQSQGKKGKG